MAYLCLDDGFAEHPKVEQLSDAAFRLQVRALCYCARNLTDGFLPLRWNKNDGWGDLVLAGLWKPTGEGFQIHNYLDRNLSAEQIKKKRAGTRKRMQEMRDRQVTPSLTPSQTGNERDNLPCPTPTPIPTPLPTPTPNEGTTRRASARRTTSLEAVEVAEYLRDAILAESPDHQCGRNGAHEKWAADIDRALRLDGRTPKALMGAVDWVYRQPEGSFWRGNIESGKKLRDKFDTLTAQARRGSGGNASEAQRWLEGQT